VQLRDRIEIVIFSRLGTRPPTRIIGLSLPRIHCRRKLPCNPIAFDTVVMLAVRTQQLQANGQENSAWFARHRLEDRRREREDVAATFEPGRGYRNLEDAELRPQKKTGPGDLAPLSFTPLRRLSYN
jgi:hypothetical protein